jgi:uncharacterized protein with von Willebrand factor type A (vWA) domain
MATGFSDLYRYTVWDGKLRQKQSAEDLLGALSDDFLQSGNLEQALRSLLRHGMPASSEQRMSGVYDMIRNLREQRREQLQRYNLDSVLDGIKEQLDEILAMEQQTINEWLAGNGDASNQQKKVSEDPTDCDSTEYAENQTSTNNQVTDDTPEKRQSGSSANRSGGFSNEVLKNIATSNQEQLEKLPDDIGGQIKSLQDYEFLNPDAQKDFLKLMQQLRDAMTQTFFKDVSEMINSMSEGDLTRMKDMLKALNDMLNRKIAEEDPGFEQFMNQFGDMFGENPPESLEDLLDQMEAQMAATQSMMNSLSVEQRQQMESLLGEKLGDPELQNELMKLGKELAFLNPQTESYRFSGEESIDFQSAMKLMDELQQLDTLEKQLHDVKNLSDLDNINEDLVKELLGEEGLDDIDDLKNLLETLEKAGFIRKQGDKWDLTPRGSRMIGQKALEEIYRKLKQVNLGGHRSTKDGHFGDQQEDSKAYQFGDPLRLHITHTLKNAIIRQYSEESTSPQTGQKINLQPDDFEVHRHELNTKTSTVLLLDLSLSMALREAFLPAKKVTLALHNLISSRFPRDSLDIIGFSAYAREIKANELTTVEVDQFTMGTNMQHALILAEKKLSREHSGTKQIIMISDGEPTAHLEDGYPYFEYPPNPLTITKTLLAVKRCTQKNITINTFMLDESPFLRSFMNQIAKMNGGRVFYTSAHHLGQYILHDYVENKRKRVA